MLVKRVIYKHRNHLLVIGGSVHKSELVRTRSAPPDPEDSSLDQKEIVIETRNKAMALETPDGRILTKELLDNFVDSSEEEHDAEQTAEEPRVLEGAESGPRDRGSAEVDFGCGGLTAGGEADGAVADVEQAAGALLEKGSGAVDAQHAAHVGALGDGDAGGAYVPPAFVEKMRDKGAGPDSLGVKVYSIGSILGWQGREAIEIRCNRSIFSKGPASLKSTRQEPKKYDAVSTFRLELNRAAKSTIEGVLSSIRGLKIKSEAEMSEMARILFEKAISEPNYLIIYVYIIRDLYKTFLCEEERGHVTRNTVFFTNICHLCKETFKNRVSWSYSVEERNLGGMTMEERIRYEDEYEEKEIAKLKKKGRILGCIRLLGSLYCQSIISDIFVLVILRDLLANIGSSENIETMCVLLECCGEKLFKRHSQELSGALEAVKEVSTQVDKRTKFLILDLFDNTVPKWKNTAATKSQAERNTFHGMVIEEDSGKVAEADPSVEQHVKGIVEELVEIGREDAQLRPSFCDASSKFSPHAFADAYLRNVVENFGNAELKTLMFCTACRDVDRSVLEEALRGIFGDLEDICCDAPYAESNFYAMLCCLRSENLICDGVFYSFASEKFEAERRRIVSGWLEDYGNAPRLERIASEDDVRDILTAIISEKASEKYQKYIEKYHIYQ